MLSYANVFIYSISLYICIYALPEAFVCPFVRNREYMISALGVISWGLKEKKRKKEKSLGVYFAFLCRVVLWWPGGGPFFFLVVD